jgi:putative membrane protein
VYGVGGEPDPRFSMANERTALAWVRTALTVVAGGIGLTSLTQLTGLSAALNVLSVVMCAIGGWVAVAAVLGWWRRERALRTGAPLPAPVALPWLAGAVAVAGLALAVHTATSTR